MTPVKKAKTEYRLMVVWKVAQPQRARAHNKRDRKHALDDAAKYDDNKRQDAWVETRTVTAWSKLEED